VNIGRPICANNQNTPAHVGSIMDAETTGVIFDRRLHVGSAVAVDVKPFNNKD